MNLEKVKKGKYLETVLGKELVVVKERTNLFGTDSLTVKTITEVSFSDKVGIMESEYFTVKYKGEELGEDDNPIVNRNLYFEGDFKYDKLNLLRIEYGR
jgi:hypothetical protein